MLRNITIAKRLRYTFFLMALIPVLVVGSFASHISKKAIVEKSSGYSLQILNALKLNIENELKRYESLADEILFNPSVQKGMEEFDTLSDKQMKKFKEGVNDLLLRKISSFPYIRDVKIVDNQGKQIYQRGYLLNDSSHLDNMILTIKANGGLVDCFGTTIYGKSYVVLSKLIYSIYNKQKMGYLLIILDQQALSKLYSNVNLGDGSAIFMMDSVQKVISAPNQQLEIEVPEGDVAVFDTVINQEKQLVMRTQIDSYPITLFGSIPYSYLGREAKAIQTNVIFITILCFVGSSLLARGISMTIIKPLRRLVTYFDEAVKQRFEVELVDESPDELGFLSRTLASMMRRMKDLIRQIEAEEKEKRELQISMLQAQINPHFLFNTLNSLRWISVMSGAHQVGDGILALSDLLRNTIVNKGELISIKEELQNINNYILIQKLRYGDCFEVIYHIPEQYMMHQTLKFILQPILENAIIHGGGDEQSQLMIEIGMAEEDERFKMWIRDNGRGFEMASVTFTPKVDKLSGIGIKNVHDRLRLNFGQQYGVSVTSELGKGTEAILYIPKIGRGDHV